ncbi:MAG TPA: murein biosynthesis integral membrane protein MurJ [Thermomicrobiales bacterium]|nr:murein biosynthesis integral membrane protein MurJ [Thermomicrobiales bacterium]
MRANAPDASVAPPGKGIALAAIVLMLGNVLSRVLGLVREQLAAGLFGTGDAIAAFTIADNIQTLLFDLLASGALQAALIPVLAQWAAPESRSREELRRIGGTLVTGVFVVVGVLVVVGIFFASRVVDGLVWFSGDTEARGPETVELTIRLVRIVLPAALLLSIATVLQAILYSIEKVTAPALSTAVRNAMIVIFTALFGSAWGVEAMAWGTLVGALAIVLIQIPPLVRNGVLPRPAFDIHHPALRQMGLLYIPVFLGLLVNSLAVVVDRGLAWGAGEYAIGAMRYATTLVQLTLGIIAAAISLAALPTLSRHFQTGDTVAYRTTLGRALVMVTVLIFPATFGLAALASPIAELLFGYGATGDEGLRHISLALLGYLPGTLAAAYDQVLIFAFYARQNTRLPVVIGVMAVLVYFAVAFSLVDAFGMMGLVIANSAQFIAHTLVIWHFGRKRFGWLASPRLSFLIPRCALAAGVAAGAGWALWMGLVHLVPETTGMADVGVRMALVGGPILLVAAIYLPWVARLCPREVAMIRTAIAQRLPGGR